MPPYLFGRLDTSIFYQENAQKTAIILRNFTENEGSTATFMDSTKSCPHVLRTHARTHSRTTQNSREIASFPKEICPTPTFQTQTICIYGRKRGHFGTRADCLDRPRRLGLTKCSEDVFLYFDQTFGRKAKRYVSGTLSRMQPYFLRGVRRLGLRKCLTDNNESRSPGWIPTTYFLEPHAIDEIRGMG